MTPSIALDRPATPTHASAPDVAALLSTARHVADAIADEAEGPDRDRAFPARAFERLREAGLLAAPLAIADGGDGLASASQHALYSVLREIGRGSLPVGRIYEGHVNALALVGEWGTEAQRKRAARDVHNGHVFGVWNTEIPHDGVRLHPLPGGRVRMEGAKTFCSGLGGVTRVFANGALPDGGWQMILVPLDTADVSTDAAWWTAEGMRASVSGRADFSAVTLGPEALVGAPDTYLREPGFSTGAVRFAAVQLGGAQALFDAAVAHLRAFGRTEHALQRARIGEAAVALESGALWLLGAARLFERPGVPVEDRIAYANLARTAIERICLDVLERVDRAVGARGLLLPSPVERIGRDLRLYLRQPNPDGALDAAAGHVLSSDRPARGSDVV